MDVAANIFSSLFCLIYSQVGKTTDGVTGNFYLSFYDLFQKWEVFYINKCI